MKILAVETSSPVGSLAITNGKNLLFDTRWTNKISGSANPSHSETLTVSTQSLLTKAQLKLSDLDLLAVGVGPGSFTGIRVGINFVRALAYSLNKPVFITDSLSILAHSLEGSVSPGTRLLVTASAFRNFIYLSYVNKSEDGHIKIEGPTVKTLDELVSIGGQAIEVVGGGLEQIKKFFQQKSDLFKYSYAESTSYPEAKVLAQMAIRAKKYCTWQEVIPLYIRRSEAEEKFGIVSE